MRYPKAFARWRLKVWDNRLADMRREWNQATAAGPNQLSPLSSVNEEAFWERLVTKALLKRTTWRKRAGVPRIRIKPVRPPKLSETDDRLQP